MQFISLTTDFGTRDWFVGTMKGAILSIAPRTTIVDITHDVLPGDVRAGAFALAAGYRFFPKGTIHVAVVDPGVGGSRNAIVVQTASYSFVGPDSGVLSFALAREKIQSIRRITNERLFLKPVSRTFHGRDVFAPVAARLSAGAALRVVGPAQKDFVRLLWPRPKSNARGIDGEIIYIDRFGNAITNIDNELIARSKKAGAVRMRGRCAPLREFYQAVGIGQAVCVPGSSGFLEVAINGGSAERELRLKIGDAVVVRF